VRQHATHPYLVTGWLWYLGTLVPVIGLIQVRNQAMADRYGYLPLIGIFIMTVWGLAEFADRNKINLSLRAATATIVFGPSVVSWLAADRILAQRLRPLVERSKSYKKQCSRGG
jgi:ABC-type uncharacterized transport system YnjBCD permease subunit